MCLPLEMEVLPLYREPPGTARLRREQKREARREKREARRVKRETQRVTRASRVHLPSRRTRSQRWP
jgi:hypothetical protein